MILSFHKLSVHAVLRTVSSLKNRKGLSVISRSNSTQLFTFPNFQEESSVYLLQLDTWEEEIEFTILAFTVLAFFKFIFMILYSLGITGHMGLSQNEQIPETKFCHLRPFLHWHGLQILSQNFKFILRVVFSCYLLIILSCALIWGDLRNIAI